MKVGDWVVPKSEAWEAWIKRMHYEGRPLPSPLQVIVVGVDPLDKGSSTPSKLRRIDHPVAGCVLLTGAYRWWPIEELDPVAGPTAAPCFLDLYPGLEADHAPDH